MKKFTVYPGKYVKASSIRRAPKATLRAASDVEKKAKCKDDECEEDEDVAACDDVKSSQTIKAEKVKSKFDQIRDILGEKEWYYIEEYILNGDGKHTLKEVLYDEDAWDDYCDWKMKEYKLKPSISASTRIKARRYLR